MVVLNFFGRPFSPLPGSELKGVFKFLLNSCRHYMAYQLLCFIQADSMHIQHQMI